MPIYEYECPNCQFVKEELSLKSNHKRPMCPKCGQAKMEKIMSVSNFKLKGSGWYATDYGNKKPKKNERKPT